MGARSGSGVGKCRCVGDREQILHKRPLESTPPELVPPCTFQISLVVHRLFETFSVVALHGK